MKHGGLWRHRTRSRATWRLFVLVPIAAVLLAGCGGAGLPMYPGAKAADLDEGVSAVSSCKDSARLLVGFGEKQVKLSPQSYSTPDSLETVKAWYQQKLADWESRGASCENGISYLFPKRCTAATTPCQMQVYISGKASGGTWIVLFSR